MCGLVQARSAVRSAPRTEPSHKMSLTSARSTALKQRRDITVAPLRDRLDPKSPYTASAGPVRRKRAARAGAPLLPVKRSQADLQAALEAAAAAKAVSKTRQSAALVANRSICLDPGL